MAIFVRVLACYFLTAAAFAGGPLPIRPEEVGMSAERLERLTAGMQRYIDRGEIPGNVVLVARHGRLVYLNTQGMMNVDSDSPMKRDTIFRIFSMTKPVTAVALMMLVEEGRLRLTDPVSKFIPEYKNPKVVVATPGTKPSEIRVVPAEREITVQDLMTFTSGVGTGGPIGLLPEGAKFQKESSPGEDIATYTRRLATLPLLFQPGTAYKYGTAGIVLGRLVEVASGERFDRFLAERIFRPLEMSDTFFYVPDEKLHRLVTAYTPVQPSGVRPVAPPAEMRGSQVFFDGGGGLFSTIDDYWHFCEMMLNMGSRNGVRLLSRKSIELMTTNHIGNLGHKLASHGYGWGLCFRILVDVAKSAQLGSVGTYGWSGGMGTTFFVDPKEQTIGILMIQMNSYDSLNIRNDLVTLTEQAIID